LKNVKRKYNGLRLQVSFPCYTTDNSGILFMNGRRQRGQGGRAPLDFLTWYRWCVFQEVLSLWKHPNSHQPS